MTLSDEIEAVKRIHTNANHGYSIRPFVYAWRLCGNELNIFFDAYESLRHNLGINDDADWDIDESENMRVRLVVPATRHGFTLAYRALRRYLRKPTAFNDFILRCNNHE